MEIVIQVVLLAVGFVMLIKGADWFVDGAAGVAGRLGIPQLVIGLTIVAMGTSAPEAAVSISAAFKGSADITIGNIVGSNILNVFIILGLSAVVTPLAVSKTTVRYEIPFTILITILLLVLGLDGTITFVDGVILWVVFLAYLTYLFLLARKQQGVGAAFAGGGQAEPGTVEGQQSLENQKKQKQAPVWKLLFLIIIGLLLIIAGSNVSVDAATAMARYFGMSERFIGLTIVALGTSLPELFTSVSAAWKGNTDIAIGNIIGSNVFNILFVVGTSALIIPIPFAEAFHADFYVAAASVIMLLVCCLPKKRLNRLSGALMLAAYGLYFFFICL